MTEFHYIGFAQEVIFGAGSLARLSEAVDRFHWRRLMLCASNSARRSGHVSTIEAALGERLVAIYDYVQPHVPDFQVGDAVALAAEHQVDAVIGLGSGSPIGMAKAVSQALEEKRTGQPARATFPTEQPLVPVIVIPTTYAGSEMTAVYGITHHDAAGLAHKVTVTDPKITPKLVIYDPQLTLDLPPDLTAASGINALAHCVEAVYSITRHPLSTVTALSGAQHIVHALPRCYAAGDDVEARTEMFIGSHLAAVALSTVTMGLHHGLCHVLGGTAGVPHGVANAIVLPHAMRFNLDTTAPQLAQLAGAIGLPMNNQEAETAAAVVQHIDNLISHLNLPRQLRDAGVSKADLPHLAQMALQSRAVQSNPKPIRDAAQIEALLEAMW